MSSRMNDTGNDKPAPNRTAGKTSSKSGGEDLTKADNMYALDEMVYVVKVYDTVYVTTDR